MANRALAGFSVRDESSCDVLRAETRTACRVWRERKQGFLHQRGRAREPPGGASGLVFPAWSWVVGNFLGHSRRSDAGPRVSFLEIVVIVSGGPGRVGFSIAKGPRFLPHGTSGPFPATVHTAFACRWRSVCCAFAPTFLTERRHREEDNRSVQARVSLLDVVPKRARRHAALDVLGGTRVERGWVEPVRGHGLALAEIRRDQTRPTLLDWSSNHCVGTAELASGVGPSMAFRACSRGLFAGFSAAAGWTAGHWAELWSEIGGAVLRVGEGRSGSVSPQEGGGGGVRVSIVVKCACVWFRLCLCLVSMGEFRLFRLVCL